MAIWRSRITKKSLVIWLCRIAKRLLAILRQPIARHMLAIFGDLLSLKQKQLLATNALQWDFQRTLLVREVSFRLLLLALLNGPRTDQHPLSLRPAKGKKKWVESHG
jgi:hypothetical protein